MQGQGSRVGHAGPAPEITEKWIRVQPRLGSSYPSLVLLAEEKPGQGLRCVEEKMTYTVRIGSKIFQSKNPRALVRLAVATRRTAVAQSRQASEPKETAEWMTGADVPREASESDCL